MSRPLLIEFPGAVYHVTSRGDRREPIYLDALAELARSAQREVPRAQRLAPTRASSRKTKPPGWKQCLAAYAGNRDAALLHGDRELGMTMTALARAAGLSVSRVSRVIAAVEAAALGLRNRPGSPGREMPDRHRDRRYCS